MAITRCSIRPRRPKKVPPKQGRWWDRFPEKASFYGRVVRSVVGVRGVRMNIADPLGKSAFIAGGYEFSTGTFKSHQARLLLVLQRKRADCGTASPVITALC
jgi:hypothetical protein